MAMTKALEVPFADGCDVRDGDTIYYLQIFDEHGKEARPLYGKVKALPGEAFTRRALRNPAALNELLKSGRAKKAGVYRGLQSPELYPWFEDELRRRWNREHLAENLVSEAERQEVQDEPSVFSMAPPDPGTPVYRAAKPITSMVGSIGVLEKDSHFTPDALHRQPSRATALAERALTNGQIQKVGTINKKGRVEWLSEDQRSTLPEEPQRLDVDLREIYGAIGGRQALYSVRQAFHGFESGDLITPAALLEKSLNETEKRVRKLRKSEYIEVIGRWDPVDGLIAASEDNFEWARKRRAGDDWRDFRKAVREAEKRETA